MIPRETRLTSDAPGPRRYRWPWRGVLIVIGWLALLLLVRLGWDGYSRHAFERVLSDARTGGRLLEVADVESQPMRDAENGAYWLIRAMRLADAIDPNVMTPDRQEALADPLEMARRVWLGFPLADDERARLVRLAPVLVEVRAARACPSGAWPVQFRLPMSWWTIPHVREARPLARLVTAAAMIASVDGDQAQAIELLRDAFAISRHVRDPRLAGASLAIAESVDVTACAGLGRCLGPLGERDESELRQAIESLVVELCDANVTERAWREALRGEALIARESALAGANPRVPAGRPGPLTSQSVFDWLVAPGFRLDAARRQRIADAILQFGSPGGERNPGARSDEDADQSLFIAQVTRSGAPWMEPFDRMPSRVARNRLWREATACLLALRLYFADRGALPESLGELVPEYLPAVPIDPRDPDRGPIRYIAGLDDPRVYSLGPNGIDDGGVDRGERRVGGARDDVFRLNGPRRIDTVMNVRIGPIAPADGPPGLAALFPPASLAPESAREQLLQARADDRKIPDAEREQDQDRE